MKHDKLRRELSSRHIFFVSIGSAIGTGLFYGSVSSIKLAGPSVLLSYLVCGMMVYLVMRALGEMTVQQPIAGSFGSYAAKYISPYAGFITGWAYVFEMFFVCLADITAVSIYFKFWFPNVPFWVWILLVIGILTFINLLNVKVFAELESALSLVKILAIIAMILCGAIVIFEQIGSTHSLQNTLANLWQNSGFFPQGWQGFVASFAIVIFAFGGIEIIGIISEETKDPERNIPKAINNIPIRILLFYLLSLFVILSIIPW